MTRSLIPSSLLAAVVAAGVAASGCPRSQAEAAPQAPAAAPSPSATGVGAAAPVAAELPRLVFFMNPNGRPCQMQERILEEMSGQLQGRAVVVRYRTTEPAEIVRFEQYGIRALPELLLTDAAGRELRRAPPGIQSPAEVLELVGR